MVSVSWSHPATDTRRLALILPGGSGYTADGPLLYWTRRLLIDGGWSVASVTWTITEKERADPEKFVGGVANGLIRGTTSSGPRLIVGKSFGCHALPWAVDAGVLGVWLTPVVTHGPMRTALSAAGADHLVVGGDHDDMWKPGDVGASRADIVTVPHADHSLEIGTEWRASLRLQSSVFERIAAHIERRGRAHAWG